MLCTGGVIWPLILYPAISPLYNVFSNYAGKCSLCRISTRNDNTPLFYFILNQEKLYKQVQNDD